MKSPKEIISLGDLIILQIRYFTYKYIYLIVCGTFIKPGINPSFYQASQIHPVVYLIIIWNMMERGNNPHIQNYISSTRNQ